MEFQFGPSYAKRNTIRVLMAVANAAIGDSRVIKTAQTIHKLGFKVTLVGIGGESSKTLITQFPFEIVQMRNPRYLMEDMGLWKINGGAIDYAKFAELFAQQIVDHSKRQYPFDILHTHDMIGLSVGAYIRRHIGQKCFWIHDIHEYVAGLTDIAENLRDPFHKAEREHIHEPDVLTTVSEPLARKLREAYDLSQIHVLLNAPRLSDFDNHFANDVRTSARLERKTPQICYLGNVKPIRGVDLVVTAIEKLPKVHLSVVSNSTSGLNGLTTMAADLKIAHRLHTHPYVQFYNVTSYVRTATVGVHPIRRYPNSEIALPNKLFEYMHAGIPSIVSDSAAMKAFVAEHDIGCVFESGNSESLSAQIEICLDRVRSDLGWRDHILAASRRFNWEIQEDTLARIYDSYVGLQKIPSASNVTQGKIAHLPTASAGQPRTLSDGLSRIGRSAVSLAISRHPYGYEPDEYIENAFGDIDRVGDQLNSLAARFDIFHFHSRTLLHSSDRRYPTANDALALKTTGKRLYFSFRGSECRVGEIFRLASPYHYVNDEPSLFRDVFSDISKTQYIESISRIFDGIFVTDPELQSYVPNSVILPRVVNLDEYDYSPSAEIDCPLIVHAPSNRGVKGTQFVLEAVNRLRDDGFNFEFSLVEGVSHEEAKALYRSADIVIDQLRIGWYGVLGVEAMALGKPVISYIRDDIKHYLPTPLPLAIANPDNLLEVLKQLIQDSELRQSLGSRARDYAVKMHDASAVASNLAQLYDTKTVGSQPSSILDFVASQQEQDYSNSKGWAIDLRGAGSSVSKGFRRLRFRFLTFLSLAERDGWRSAGRKAFSKLTPSLRRRDG
ncbi:glycosyltransferase [Fodinicurvata sp. EGI_FJ10296]|uniref:glycosyltransferase n=1 Tax=Fodinicurvata sp. EGI_FJ10296 TaxID=3231908 RepID=UPI0034558573